MADTVDPPALKRKREEKDKQRKRSRTEKKGKLSLGKAGEAEVAIPVGTGKGLDEDKNTIPSSFPLDGVSEQSATLSASQKKNKTGKPEFKKGGDINDISTQLNTPVANSDTRETSKELSTSVNEKHKSPRKRNRKKKMPDNRGQSQKIGDVIQNTGDNKVAKDDVPATELLMSGNIGHPGSTQTSKKTHERKLPRDRRQRDGAGRDSQGVNHESTSNEAPTPENGSKQTLPKQDNTISRVTHKPKRSSKKDSWWVSAPFGGWFLPQDPVFSKDEKFMVLANTRGVQIYSIETSLLVNSLSVGSGVLTAYAISSTNPHHVYISNSAGLITLWDWKEGKKIGRWDIGTNIRQIEVVSLVGTTQDLVFCHEVGNNHVINVHALRTRDQKGQTELKSILKTKSPVQNIEVLSEGNILVVSCARSIFIGRRQKLQKTDLQDLEYMWREFATSKRITTVSSHIRMQGSVGEARKASQHLNNNLDIALGDESGMIHLFENILSISSGIEKSQKKGDDSQASLDSLTPKRLHWHRDAVGAVKWSRDGKIAFVVLFGYNINLYIGNYLISGGDETVLVIWQLSTGKQQYLPHLTAAIEKITVSPSGDSYAILLANNSVIVLSTTELEAKTNIIGIQSRRVDIEELSRELHTGHYSFDIFSQVPMIVDPKNKHQVIFSMPSSQPRHQEKRLRPEPYVQTYDIASQTPVSRQALTRNNATDPNMGPEGRRIDEPNITFVQISHDGKWLATVDEWHPPYADMVHLEEGIPEFNEEERMFRRESYLKFWEWNEKSVQWVLQSRVDAPHFHEDVGAVARVFDLVPDPSSHGFATVGEDRFVRIWRPKTRIRNGVVVRGADRTSQEGVVTWSLNRAIELSSKLDVYDSTDETDALAPRTSRLAFSADGSVLAVGVSWLSDSDPGVIQIIDTISGTIRRSITELDVIALSCLGIVNRHLVVIGDAITVWDLVLDQAVYSIPFDFTKLDQLDTSTLVRLAINDNDGTFAVACPVFEKREESTPRGIRHFEKPTSKISVFDPRLPKALWSSAIPGIALSLVSARDGKGYIVLDSFSSLRTLSPRASALQMITPPPESPIPSHTTTTTTGHSGDEFESDEGGMRQIGDRLEALIGSDELFQNSENDKPVVRKEQLRGIFDVESHVLPPVRDLFDAVVGLYARKPRNVASQV